MKIEHKLKLSLFYEKNLFSFYLKHRIFSIKFVVCILLSLLDIFEIANDQYYQYILSQSELDIDIYWGNMISYMSFFYLLIPVIMIGDIVSGEFSNKSAMIIYTTESRNKILTIKLLCMVISILILIVFHFSAFLVLNATKTDLLVSIDIFLVGFLIVFVQLIFRASLTFMISALTRNVLLSYILPLFYLFMESSLIFLELELFSYDSYAVKAINFFDNLILYDNILLNNVILISIIVFFGIPILIILITFHAFKQLDIRVN